jgi:hypothetical protein
MFLLPKGNPLHENIPVTKVRLPEILEKLKAGSFTGYLNFTFPAAVGVLFFEAGKMSSAMLERGVARASGLEAIAGLCDQIVAGDGSLDVYRLSPDLTMCLHALLHGEMLYKAQELRLIDVKGLLEKMKTQRLNGCLRIYTESRSALIFYKDGAPLGFFHDGSHNIETSATESQKIAKLPGAKIDVLSTRSTDELMHYDLLEIVNVERVWDSSVTRFAVEMEKRRREMEERAWLERDARLRELEEDLKEVASAYLGKIGRTLVEKELGERGGRSSLQQEADVTRFLAGVEKGAKLLTSLTKLKEMLETMQQEIASRANS